MDEDYWGARRCQSVRVLDDRVLRCIRLNAHADWHRASDGDTEWGGK